MDLPGASLVDVLESSLRQTPFNCSARLSHIPVTKHIEAIEDDFIGEN